MTLRQTLSAFAGDFATLMRTRIELFALEFAQERSRLVTVILLGLAASLFLLMGLLVFSVWIALLFWETEYRYLAVALLALAYLLIGGYFLLKLRRRLRRGGQVFAASVEVLTQDLEMLRASFVDAGQTNATAPERSASAKGGPR